QALIRPKKEKMILDYRTTDSAIENVPMEDLRTGTSSSIECIAGIQECVTVELTGASMEGIRAGANNLVHDRARVTTVFRVERVGDNAHFGNRVRIWRKISRKRRIQRDVVEIRAVNQIV